MQTMAQPVIWSDCWCDGRLVVVAVVQMLGRCSVAGCAMNIKQCGQTKCLITTGTTTTERTQSRQQGAFFTAAQYIMEEAQKVGKNGKAKEKNKSKQQSGKKHGEWSELFTSVLTKWTQQMAIITIRINLRSARMKQ